MLRGIYTGMLLQTNQAVSLRNNDLDLIKGLLVFIMILFHCASMATNASSELLDIANYISFIHFAFLIITGFLCGWYYVPQLESASPVTVRKRLRFRALKIIMILLFSNVALYATGIFDHSKLRDAISTFDDLSRNLLLSVKGSLIAFEILLPIALFLLFASFILRGKHILAISVLFTGVAIFLGNWSSTFNTVAFGGIGFIAGLLSQSSLTKKILTFYEETSVTGDFIIFLGCLLSILLLKYFFFLCSSFLPFHFYYTAETFFWFFGLLAIIKLIGSDFLSDSCAFLGSYTLLGYILQMLIIRSIFLLLNSMDVTGYYYYIANVFISTILLFLILQVVSKIRNNYKIFNSLYRFIFQ